MSPANHLYKFSSWSRATKAVAHLLQWAKKIKSHAPSAVSKQESAESVICIFFCLNITNSTTDISIFIISIISTSISHVTIITISKISLFCQTTISKVKSEL